jgi:hypothetical protein
MAVLSARELARSFQHRFGEAPTAQLRYALTLSDPATTQQEMLNYVGIFHGSFHPEYTYLRCIEGAITENDPDMWHSTITYSYAVPERGNVEFEPNPLARPDVWSFSTGGAQVPALTYYEGAGNGDVRPLTNSAGDYFEGLLATEAEVRASISGNRSTFPLATAAAVTNAINASPYLGGAAFTWQCSGIAAQQATEVVNDIEINYWQVSVELVYRQTGWPLLLPDIGFHYLTGADPAKAICYVRDDAPASPTKGQDIPAATPQPLDTNGSLLYTGGSSGPPNILTRRINPVVDFSSFFGTPPF